MSSFRLIGIRRGGWITGGTDGSVLCGICLETFLYHQNNLGTVLLNLPCSLSVWVGVAVPGSAICVGPVWDLGELWVEGGGTLGGFLCFCMAQLNFINLRSVAVGRPMIAGPWVAVT